MSKHSEGPWKLENWSSHDQDGALEACGFQVVAAAGHAISAFITEGATEAEEADASLIAAAPEMLEALEVSAAFMEIASDWNINEAEINGEMKSTYDWLDIVKSAIAKAKGEPK